MSSGGIETTVSSKYDTLVALVCEGRTDELIAALKKDSAAVNNAQDWHKDSLLVS